MADFRMPSLGADMDAGTVTEWLVAPGDTVHKGDIVAVVDTAKSEVEVETFDDGVVREILVPPGRQVPVGTVLATIGNGASPPRPPRASPVARHRAAELGIDLASLTGTGRNGTITRADVERATHEKAAETARVQTPVRVPPPEPPRVRPVEKVAGDDRPRPRVSPYARRLAADAGVDLESLVGSGPAGVVRAADVRAAMSPRTSPTPTAAPTPAHVDATGPSGVSGRDQVEMRAAIARLMATSKREIPHYYLQTTVDLHNAVTWMREHNRTVPVAERLVPAALVLAATARAVAEHPELNGHWVDGAFRPADRVRLGVAISLRGGGLLAPAIEDADSLGVAELMARLRDLVTRARAGRLRRAELVDPSITVTNLGDQGVETVFGVIYPPQVALVGVGRVREAPVAVDGLVGVRPTVNLTLSADHRATDGFTGARFLDAIDDLLHRPEEWTP